MIDHAGQLDRRITIQKPVVAASNTIDVETAFETRVGDDFGQVDDACLTSDINGLGGVDADLFGQSTRDYETLANVWAKVMEKVGNEGENGDMISATKRVDFFIRYRDDINERMRIVYNNETYKIHAIQLADAREAFQMIRCEYTDA